MKRNSWVSSAFDDFDDFGNDHVKPTISSVKASRKGSSSQSTKGVLAGTKGSLGGKRLAKALSDSSLWSEKHSPKLQTELAVHKKKIEEVETWLNHHLVRKKHSQKAPLLLLTGASGSGKTATIRVICKQLHTDIQEWNNPLPGEAQRDEEWTFQNYADRLPTQSQSKQFSDFLLRANKYNKLQIFNQEASRNKIILVEEFPNAFLKDATLFHSTLRSYLATGRCPLVFIISDSSSGQSAERHLFPKDIQLELGVHSISFNPIAPTSLSKVLTKIATEEHQKNRSGISVPAKATIESLAMGSAGDIRGAINSLQFACLKDTSDLCRKKGVKRTNNGASVKLKKSQKATKNDTNSEDMSIGGKDASLFMFRALGKILYCKRCEKSELSDDVAVPDLPKHLVHQYRDPLTINPESVVERCCLSGDVFTAYLHQNYPEFYTSIDDLAASTEYISSADYLTNEWSNREALREYASSVATRGIIHSNSSRATTSSISNTNMGWKPHTEIIVLFLLFQNREALREYASSVATRGIIHSNSSRATTGSISNTNMGWKPLHKPQYYTVRKKALDNSTAAKGIFKDLHYSKRDLETDILPYLAMTNSTLRYPGQITFLQELTRFPKFSSTRSEVLSEKDIMDSLETDSNLEPPSTTSSLPNATDLTNSQQTIQPPIEEEVIIEDYDDDDW
ncbi:unnamed protein product [Owenia fusiformis]|uniref:Uncharacterized protein n=1 Tax=Owenia fusiformis TaxID=6347 RepID=A0A8J1XR52_OWEFU|nr:unnamed protein product [Owenia fusiformis]